MQKEEQKIEIKVVDDFPQVDDRYTIESVIGTGGMSVVYKVRNNATGRFSAMKVLKSEMASDESAKQRFEQEAKLVKGLLHPNIVRMDDYCVTADGTPYLLMEWLDGITLADYIKDKGAMSPDAALPILSQILNAVNYAHQEGIVHRDIKPTNILLLPKPDGSLTAMVMDFGIAKLLNDEKANDAVRTDTGNVLGSPAYMSPEQCLGEPVDERSDVYSIACLLCEMLTGRNPFIASTPMATLLNHLEAEPETLIAADFEARKIPQDMERVILKALAKRPDLRYQTVAQLQQGLFPSPGIPRRAAASAIDLVTFLVIYGLIGALAKCIAFAPIAQAVDYFKYCDALPKLAMVVVYVAYFALFEWAFEGTPGKLLLGLRVTNSNGGRPSFAGAMMRAMTFAAMITFINVAPFVSDAASAIDRAYGTQFGWLMTSGYFVMLGSFLYLFYSMFYAFREQGQWDFDRLFNRNVLRVEDAKLCQLQGRPVKFSMVAYMVAGMATMLIAGMTAFQEITFTKAWADPNIDKDLPVSVTRDVSENTKLTGDMLLIKPRLCSGGWNYYPDGEALVGKHVDSSMRAGDVIRVGDLTEPFEPKDTAEMLIHRAHNDEIDGKKQDAIDKYLEAIKLDSRNRRALEGLSRLYEQMGQHKAAQRMQTAANDCRYDYVGLGVHLLNNGMYREALAVTKAGIAADPADRDCWDMLESVLRKLDANATADSLKKPPQRDQ